jgi:hypothetical protein
MLESLKKPVWQFIIFLLLTLITLIVIRPAGQESLWTAAGIIYGVFILSNSLMILNTKSPKQYFWISLGFSALYPLSAAAVVMVYGFIFSVNGPAESSMVFLIFIYHPFTLGLILLLEWIFVKAFTRRKI